MDAFTRALVAGMAAVFEPRGPVVEIGSYQVEHDPWSDQRPLFAGEEYIGCDMRPGPGVDRVERLEALSFADGFAGTVLCLNVIEHAWEFRRGMDEIRRVTADGGLALVSTAFAFRVHGHPEDYWRFTPRAMERLLEGFESVLYGWQGHAKMPRLVFALGLKRRLDGAAALAEAWRRETLQRWRDRPSIRDSLGGALGSLMFGREHFRIARHWRDLTVCVGDRASG